jgi:SAM-dependent methyltransferase
MSGNDGGPSVAREPASRFYDGRIYASVMDRFLVGLRGWIVDRVEPGLKVLDAGCGTGDLVFRLAPNAESVLGVELSPAMVEHARGRLEATPVGNVDFRLGDLLTVLADEPDGAFDVATLMLVLHEMPTAARPPVLQTLTRVAREVLCLDFAVPMPWNFAGLRNRGFEVAAGATHFAAFRDYNRLGGVAALAQKAGLECELLQQLGGRSFSVHRLRRVR